MLFVRPSPFLFYYFVTQGKPNQPHESPAVSQTLLCSTSPLAASATLVLLLDLYQLEVLMVTVVPCFTAAENKLHFFFYPEELCQHIDCNTDDTVTSLLTLWTVFLIRDL